MFYGRRRAVENRREADMDADDGAMGDSIHAVGTLYLGNDQYNRQRPVAVVGFHVCA